ncbi:hypothetical protein N657DRAFT_704836 [Parathielavia appendiculata]|uniref:F-box domain-containing protein n=1 Tax=Parathielavia appendiculata TaxID=2587402 RepID=A0AAN6U9V0_9PEZI|nr:hypothetical protein N657DRAFT_704836 [Parathielavia appendiculata]
MKFFRRKDKRKNGGDSSHSRMPGFGSSTSGKQTTPAYGGHGYGNSRSDDSRAFGSSPSGSYNPRSYAQSNHFQPRPTRASAAVLAQFPEAIFERIFAFVCPHTRDESYATCEQSSVEDACMLCDLRDLAHCVAICRRWKAEAVKLLYHSIRIDSVHYCDLEAILAERRKRRSSFFDRNGEPEDPAQARLKLLCRTLREDPVRRGRLVQFLKMPYMLREACQADLARTIAVTPNLHYVDLPEGLFTDEPAFLTLRLEVQARCLELRKMTYMGGSENSLQTLATGRVWTKLEVLELIRIDMEPSMLRHVLGYLSNLRALKISQTPSFTDEALAWNEMLPPFPPVEEFILTNIPNVTSEGLKAWLVLPEARQALRVLTLNGTGVRAWSLQDLVAYTPRLKHLSIIDSVSATMHAAAGTHNIPPLSSTSLESLHFEITPAPSTPKYSGVTASYYNYLAGSLLSGGLPNLRAVYVRDPNFPDLLLGLPPPAPSFAEGRLARPASSGSLSPFASPNRPSHQGGNGGFPPLLPPSAPFTGGGGRGHRPQGSVSSLNGSSFNPRFSSNNPFAASLASPAGFAPPPAGGVGVGGGAGGEFTNLPAKLEVFTKSDDDQLGWSFVRVGGVGGGGHGGRRGGGLNNAAAAVGGMRPERPLSSYGLGADVLGGSAAGWSSGAGARRSVLVSGRGEGGGGGGFLAVPSEGFGGRGAGRKGMDGGQSVGGGADGFGDGGENEWPRPKSSAGERKREKLDLWR